jgi:hypothetical protein
MQNTLLATWKKLLAFLCGQAKFVGDEINDIGNALLAFTRKPKHWQHQRLIVRYRHDCLILRTG